MNNSRLAPTDPPASKPSAEHSPANRSATAIQRRLAFWICLILCLTTVVLLPYAQTQWLKMPAFLPAYQTAAIGIYLITAYLMYGHYDATRSVSLLHLSAGCLYTAGILLVQFLSFPGAFGSEGSLIGGSQTTI